MKCSKPDDIRVATIVVNDLLNKISNGNDPTVITAQFNEVKKIVTDMVKYKLKTLEVK